MARAWPDSRITVCFGVLAVIYYSSIWFDAAGSRLPQRWLPSFVTYFTQAAALFPTAAEAVIDYRVEGWDCAASRWEEIDVRPDFPMDSDTKESRFHRTLHFFRQNRQVMQALEAFVVSRHNLRAREGLEAVGEIGGIRTQSVRLPIPEPGAPVSAYVRRPAAEYPEEQRHYWFWTPESRRSERCGYPTQLQRKVDALRPKP